MATQTPFITAIQQLCDEKGIDKNMLLETVKAAYKAAYRKDYGHRDNLLDVELDGQTGAARILLVKNVVEDVVDENMEIPLREAKKIDPAIEIGGQIKQDVTPADYGRIAAQSAKQVIIQRIQEAERDVMYDLFKDRENEMINAMVHRVDRDNIYVTLDNRITTMLKARDQIPGERYSSGQRIKLYLDKVIKTSKGPELLISRRHPNLVRKLMELEIPEVKSGQVEIKAIARRPGVRCKVAVFSSDPKIDPIGSCVGQKGIRVKNVTGELGGKERIDIIQWSENPSDFIKAALSPAEIDMIELNEATKRAGVYVKESERPQAIGKEGQNVTLASELTGWEIDIKDVAELKGVEPEKEEKKVVEKVESLGLPDEITAKLVAANLTDTEQIRGLSVNDLLGIENMTEEEAKTIVNAVGKTKAA